MIALFNCNKLLKEKTPAMSTCTIPSVVQLMLCSYYSWHMKNDLNCISENYRLHWHIIQLIPYPKSVIR